MLNKLIAATLVVALFAGSAFARQQGQPGGNSNQNRKGQEEKKPEAPAAKPDAPKDGEKKVEDVKFDQDFYNQRIDKIIEVIKTMDIIFTGEVKELSGAPEFWNKGRRIPNAVEYTVLTPFKGGRPKEEEKKADKQGGTTTTPTEPAKDKEKGKTELIAENEPVKVIHMVSTDFAPGDPRSRINPTSLSPGTKVIILATREDGQFVTNDIEVSIIPCSAKNEAAIKKLVERVKEQGKANAPKDEKK